MVVIPLTQISNSSWLLDLHHLIFRHYMQVLYHLYLVWAHTELSSTSEIYLSLLWGFFLSKRLSIFCFLSKMSFVLDLLRSKNVEWVNPNYFDFPVGLLQN